ncbi:hypothetical protein J1605_019491 [Eschrichtius robustus]|uniref:Coiled-coil domain-containing protein n=1 Tax=Eschrichtius robustus TaxID=9764 RepID=A0AB34HPH0_ESCRO|nr:hypothetical protein J1605_019491 [Eschrichtius robustus]
MLGIQVLCGVWEAEESEMLMVSDHVKQWPHRCVNLSPSSLPRGRKAFQDPLGLLARKDTQVRKACLDHRDPREQLGYQDFQVLLDFQASQAILDRMDLSVCQDAMVLRDHLENLTDQKKVLLENQACRESLEKMVPPVSLALRGGKETWALQDFVVQQNIMMHTRKREMKEFQAHQGPRELLAHRVPVVPPEPLEVLVVLFFAEVHLETVDFQAIQGLQESQELMGPKVGSISDVSLLARKHPIFFTYCITLAISEFVFNVYLIIYCFQEDKGQLALKESQGPQEALVFQDFQDSQVLRVTQDLKEKKVKHLSQRDKWVPQGIQGSEDILEERAWMEFLELRE